MKETVETIINWNKETFPDNTEANQVDKFNEELIEYGQDASIEEFADCFIATMGQGRFSLEGFICMMKVLCLNITCFSAFELANAITNKMDENRHKRTWKNNHHIN